MNGDFVIIMRAKEHSEKICNNNKHSKIIKAWLYINFYNMRRHMDDSKVVNSSRGPGPSCGRGLADARTARTLDADNLNEFNEYGK